MPKLNAPLEHRFWKRVTIKSRTECWLWTGPLDNRGYGTLSVEGTKKKAHRLAYELTFGPIPGGLVIDHKCRTRACVNPHHLEPVTNRINVQRGSDARTHCKHGHEYTEANTYWNVDRYGHGHRQCVICRREAEARRPPRRHR